MAAERADKTPIDYVLLILTPVLIMALVGSLVFFLIEVLYAGAFKDRLRLAFFCYVFGAVLVARISMMADIAARAPIYGAILAVLGWIVLQVYIRYDSDSPVGPFSWLINMVLIGIVWWSTHRLTWDCTQMERDGDDAGGEGLLEAAGLEPKSARVEDLKAKAEEEAKDPPGVEGWWARFQRFREKRKKTRPLGVWVVYFALATLPVFGLGQALLDVDDAQRRQNVFWFMAIYVASGLALLLTTCFLSLRRYLRQRNVEMPVKMTATWLTTGAAIIVVLLLCGALVPRPQAEYSVLDVTPFRSEDRQASQMSPGQGNAGKDKGNPGGADAEKKDGSEGGKDAGNKDGKNSGTVKDKSNSSGGDKGQKDKGGETNSKNGKDGKSSKDGKGGKDGKGDSSSNDDNAKDDSKSSPTKSSSSTPNNPLTAVSNALGPIAQVLKWVVFAVVAVVVLFLVFRHGLKFLANFTQWARDLLASLRNFWEGLFGGAKKATTSREATAEEAELIEEAVPFTAFRNPFRDGSATQRSPKELLRYTFAALEAWARDRDFGRLPQETPLEFATRLAHEVPGLAEELRRFIGLYIRAEYARGGLPGNLTEVAQKFWERLEAVVEQPLST